MAEATRFERDGKKRVFLNLSAKEARAVDCALSLIGGSETGSWRKYIDPVLAAVNEVVEYDPQASDFEWCGGMASAVGPLPKAVWK